MPASSRDRSLATAAVWLAGAWAAWQGAAFAWTGTARHRAESAWFIFAVVLLVAGALAARSTKSPDGDETAALGRSRSRRLKAGAIFVAFSLLLYGRVLGAGLLSDDFVLLDRAVRLAWFDAGWNYVRPLPLALWWVASWTNADVVLHAITIVLHGINAWLVYRIALRLQLDGRAAAFAGLIFATLPTHVEAVAWASGVFDVAMTFFVLCSLLNMLDDTRSAIVRFLRGGMLAVAALACKETAVALPILCVTTWPLLSSTARRAAVRIAALLFAIAAIYAIGRLMAGVTLPGDSSLSGYQLKELLSRPFGAMAMNLHQDAATGVPLLPVAIAVAWPVFLAWAATSWPRDPRSFHLLLAGAAWLLASVAPLMTAFFVGADLQQSRYLYLGATLWSIAIAGIAVRRVSVERTWIVLAGLAIVVAINAGLVIHQQGRWLEAAATRDQVLRAFVSQAINCDPRLAEGLPDQVGGAYVFRNGFPEAVARLLPARQAWEPCVPRWDGVRFVPQQRATFEPSAARPPLSFLPRRD